MKALINLFSEPSPSHRSGAIMAHPLEITAPELDTIRDALKLLKDTQPEWRKAFRQTVQVKIDLLRMHWTDHIKNHG